MKKLQSLSVLFPALNDSKTLPYLIRKAVIVANQVAKSFEVIIVDDGSTDETHGILEELKKHYTYLRVVQHPYNKGYGAALRDGFAHATKQWVFYTDGDGQYDPSELLLLAENADAHVDVVNGYKLNRSDSWFRKTIGKLYNLVSHVEYKLPIRDVQCDFRLIRRRVLKNITLKASSGIICLELVVKLHAAGARFVEVGVHHYPRSYGHSQFFRPMNLIRTAREHLLLKIHEAR